MGALQLQNDTASCSLASQGSQQNQCSVTAPTGDVSKPKRLRDECIVEHGEAACTKWIEAHRLCLRAEGFNV